MPGDDERIDEPEALQLLEEAAEFIEDHPREEDKEYSALLEEEPLEPIEDTQSEAEKSPFEEVNFAIIALSQWRGGNTRGATNFNERKHLCLDLIALGNPQHSIATRRKMRKVCLVP